MVSARHRSWYNYGMPIVTCCNCKKDFYVKPVMIRRGGGKHCSRACREKARAGKVVPCKECGKHVYRQRHDIARYTQSFCSKDCSLKSLARKYVDHDHPNWRDGGFTYRQRLLRSERKHCCELCDIDEPIILAVHHVDHDRTNNSVSNLAWLCYNCHFLVHHYKQENDRWKQKRKP